MAQPHRSSKAASRVSRRTVPAPGVRQADAAGDNNIAEVAINCAPALSNDHHTLYIAVSGGDFSGGYLLALDSRTLATQAAVRLKDAGTPRTTRR